MLRQIVEDPEVTETLDAACEGSPRLRDAWEALKWLIARTPAIGHRLGYGDHVRIHKQEGYLSIGIPAITIFYEYDEHAVTILAVRLTFLTDL